MGLELPSIPIVKCVVLLPLGVVMDDPVIVVFTKKDNFNKIFL